MTKKVRLVFLLALLGALSFAQQSKPKSKPHTGNSVDSDQRISGFTPASSAKEKEVEAKFKAVPSPEQAQKWHRWLTAEPHPSGSERNNQLAREIAERWK